MKAAALLIAAIAAMAPARSAAADCAPASLAHQVLSHGGDELPASGGVLVGWTTSNDWKQGAARVDPAGHADWRFLVGKRKVRPRLEQLAPGLAVYRPARVTGSKPQKMILIDGKGGKLLTLKAGSKKRAFRADAPAVKSITMTRQLQRRGEHVEALAELDGAVPAEAVALIVYDDAGAAISWVNVRGATATSLLVYTSPGGCGVNPPGMTAPAAGTSVTLAWVDTFGRVSKRSAAVSVVDKAP